MRACEIFLVAVLVNAADLGLNAVARLRDPVNVRRKATDLEKAGILSCCRGDNCEYFDICVSVVDACMRCDASEVHTGTDDDESFLQTKCEPKHAL